MGTTAITERKQTEAKVADPSNIRPFLKRRRDRACHQGRNQTKFAKGEEGPWGLEFSAKEHQELGPGIDR